tara:strand:- start:15368 stop:17851 length:2484 start_codon:yes stop_codon:yes gene_type:complete
VKKRKVSIKVSNLNSLISEEISKILQEQAWSLVSNTPVGKYFQRFILRRFQQRSYGASADAAMTAQAFGRGGQIIGSGEASFVISMQAQRAIAARLASKADEVSKLPIKRVAKATADNAAEVGAAATKSSGEAMKLVGKKEIASEMNKIGQLAQDKGKDEVIKNLAASTTGEGAKKTVKDMLTASTKQASGNLAKAADNFAEWQGKLLDAEMAKGLAQKLESDAAKGITDVLNRLRNLKQKPGTVVGQEKLDLFNKVSKFVTDEQPALGKVINMSDLQQVAKLADELNLARETLKSTVVGREAAKKKLAGVVDDAGLAAQKKSSAQQALANAGKLENNALAAFEALSKDSMATQVVGRQVLAAIDDVAKQALAVESAGQWAANLSDDAILAIPGVQKAIANMNKKLTGGNVRTFDALFTRAVTNKSAMDQIVINSVRSSFGLMKKAADDVFDKALGNFAKKSADNLDDLMRQSGVQLAPGTLGSSKVGVLKIGFGKGLRATTIGTPETISALRTAFQTRGTGGIRGTISKGYKPFSDAVEQTSNVLARRNALGKGESELAEKFLAGLGIATGGATGVYLAVKFFNLGTWLFSAWWRGKLSEEAKNYVWSLFGANPNATENEKDKVTRNANQQTNNARKKGNKQVNQFDNNAPQIFANLESAAKAAKKKELKIEQISSSTPWHPIKDQKYYKKHSAKGFTKISTTPTARALKITLNGKTAGFIYPYIFILSKPNDADQKRFFYNLMYFNGNEIAENSFDKSTEIIYKFPSTSPRNQPVLDQVNQKIADKLDPEEKFGIKISQENLNYLMYNYDAPTIRLNWDQKDQGQ